jgi:hypothetical protein
MSIPYFCPSILSEELKADQVLLMLIVNLAALTEITFSKIKLKIKIELIPKFCRKKTSDFNGDW